MNNKEKQILSTLQIICRAENEDLAGLNWLLAGEITAALPTSLRQDILQTELGRQIQVNVWQLWLTTSTMEAFSNDDIEETLIELANEMLVEKIITQGWDGATIRLLGQIGSDRVVEHLIKLVQQSTNDYSLPGEAVEALGVAGSPMAIAEIQRLLDNELLRKNAIKALARANSPKSAEILLDLFQTTYSDQVAQAINQLSHPDIAPLLVKKISSESPPELLMALGKIGGEQAVEILKDIITQIYQRIEDKETAGLDENRYALVVAAGLDALALSLSPVAVATLVDMARQDFFAEDFREEAVRALGKMRLSLSDQVLTDIVLDSSLPAWLRATAAENLPTPLPASIEQALLTAFTRGSETADLLAPQLALALRYSSSERGRSVLRQLLRHPDRGVQNLAAQSLGLLGDPVAVPLLLEMLQMRQQQEGQLKEIVIALGQLGSASAVAPLIEVLEQESYPLLWPDAAKALATIGDPAGITYLLHKLEQDVVGAQRWSAAFGNIYRERAIPPLVEHGLASPQPEVRRNSIIGLGSIGSQAVVPALITGWRDEDEAVREATGEAFEKVKAIDAPDIIRLVLDTVEDPLIAQPSTLLRCLTQTQSQPATTTVCERLEHWLQSAAFEARIPKPTVIHYLGELQCSGIVGLLGHLLLTDPNPAIRDAAASALGLIGTSEAVSYLLKALQTETDSASLDPIQRALAQPRFLCDLIEALPLTRPILTGIALRHRLRIFADGRVTPPSGPPLPCREAMQGLIS
ncbi:MAG: hypothetical protein BroJett011_59850 [Chloroflexota bacterium]|nr:MAG: hypothetical protein BroJett011_59850 [Chloroflexota bacterium]